MGDLKISLGNWITIIGMLVMGCGVFFTLKSEVSALGDRVTVLEASEPKILAVKIENIEKTVEKLQEGSQETNKLLNELIRSLPAPR